MLIRENWWIACVWGAAWLGGACPSAWAVTIPFGADVRGPAVKLNSKEWTSVESTLFSQEPGRLIESVKDRGFHAWLTTKISVLPPGAPYDARLIAERLCADLKIVHAPRAAKVESFAVGAQGLTGCRVDYLMNGQLHTQVAFSTQPAGFQGKRVYEMHYAEFFRNAEPKLEPVRKQLISRVLASVEIAHQNQLQNQADQAGSR